MSYFIFWDRMNSIIQIINEMITALDSTVYIIKKRFLNKKFIGFMYELCDVCGLDLNVNILFDLLTFYG